MLEQNAQLNITRILNLVVGLKTSTPIQPLLLPISNHLQLQVISIIVSSIIGYSIPSIFGWVKATTQRKYLEQWINQIGKLDKNAIEDKIKGYLRTRKAK